MENNAAYLKALLPGSGIKIGKETANAFVKRKKRASSYYEWYLENYKSPAEQRREQCEEYLPCRYHSRQMRYRFDYRHYSEEY
ncbi:PREDICTED: matrix Gla protein-like isoform X2 [Crocodylus porosus]|uniref:matrix Gla protein-like isoform X2 n=1 Tax=Crocodylus porosus TaxID=8502 RepID=UPI00093EE0B3|nr:PREDICTED: matrix Gla protein-like isoform X2 [Crocodylus porosus]